ncbi:MAG: hypothetical protein H6563_01570 [Lewinellaceae bacterium]|nr:hypothetical protein [Lewinellaceae bacterium]
MNRPFFLVSLLLFALTGFSQNSFRAVYQDKNGVIRWTDDKTEVSLFGANYCLPSACDYRAAGYVTDNRKKMIDQDMAHFARMGWDGLRLCLWGDYQNTDSLGNLIVNDHLDLMDYLILKARERGIYMLLTPIVTYSSQWPDAMDDTLSARGFSTYFKKEELGTNTNAIMAQQNYLQQLLNHVNPYTGVAIKDEPSILFIEMINEPWHHPEDVEAATYYINSLIFAVRTTGCNKLLFHNYSQDFRMAVPLQKSDINGVSFAWYPSGLVAGHTLTGNYLPVVDEFPQMLKPELAKKSRIVYEFDSPDMTNGYMYPAMARTFRAAGAQFAAMFSYDMLATAPYNLGWQTHYLNMVYTPSKAVSAILAAEVMRKAPMYKNYGKYPANTTFGPFRISYEEDLGEMVTEEKFIYSNDTRTVAPSPGNLKQIIGYGSSPLVSYQGKGIYFLDKIQSGVWRLEVYPDAARVGDPFETPAPGKITTRIISRPWTMTLSLPDLGTSFSIAPLNAENNYRAIAKEGEFIIVPGVYILTADPHFDPTTLPAKVGQVGMDEFVILEAQPLPPQVVLKYRAEYAIDKPVIVEADVFGQQDPESVTLFVKPGGRGWFLSVPMQKAGGYSWQAELAGRWVSEGWMDYCIVVKNDGKIINYPSGTGTSPADWSYSGAETWQSKMVSPLTPLRLLDPLADIDKLAFTRIGDGIRWGIFRMLPASNTGEAAYRLGLPLSYDRSLDDYTISIPVLDKIYPRKQELSEAKVLVLEVRGISQQQEAFVTLVENDGTSWNKKINAGQDWGTLEIPFGEFELSKGVMLPLGYPGRWAYWFTPAEGRGGPGDYVRLENVEWLQFSIRPSGMKKEEMNEDSFLEITNAYVQFGRD